MNRRKRDNTTGSSVDAKRQSRHGLPTPVRCCGTQTRRIKNHIFQPVQKYIYEGELPAPSPTGGAEARKSRRSL